MHSNGLYTRFLPDEEATLQLGEEWSKQLSAPLTIYLEGGLGAGKTTLTRGILRGLGHTGAVKSPTYTIVESYPLDTFTLHHFDLYRFTMPEEWEDAGLDEIVCARQHLPHRMAAARWRIHASGRHLPLH